MMNQKSDKEAIWWRKYSIAENGIMHWKIGALRLAVRRLAREWQIFYETDSAWADAEETEHSEETEMKTESTAAKGRFFFNRTEATLELMPLLADRAVVTKPMVPFHVPAGQQITLYVSTPLWIRISIGEKATALEEIVIQRPSDTWFGQSTQEGELCYAGSTRGRIQLDMLTQRSFRAVTPIAIVNQSASSLVLEKIKLPVPYLSLFQGREEFLWTQVVSMIRKSEGGPDLLDIQEGPPAHLENAVLISGPREKPDKKILSGTWHMLFG